MSGYHDGSWQLFLAVGRSGVWRRRLVFVLLHYFLWWMEGSLQAGAMTIGPGGIGRTEMSSSFPALLRLQNPLN